MGKYYKRFTPKHHLPLQPPEIKENEFRGELLFIFASLGTPVFPPSACFLRQVGGWTCLLMEPPRPLAAACSGCPSTKGRSPAEMRAVAGTGVTCENTVTRQDHLHLREVNMGRKVTQDYLHSGQPGYDKMLITNFIVGGCWGVAQQVSIQPPGAGCLHSPYTFSNHYDWH